MGVTIQQIAEKAGVSRGTVDRALNNRGRISPEAEKKIRQIDAGRARHQKLLSDRKWGDREGYDLCVNTTGVEIKKLIPGLKEYALCWFGQRDGK